MPTFICELELKPVLHRSVEVEAADVDAAIRFVEEDAATIQGRRVAKKYSPWVCQVEDASTGQKFGIQHRGWAPEPFRTLQTYFFDGEQSVLELGSTLNLDRLLDAATKAVCEEQWHFEYDPVEWGGRNTGRIYRLSITATGTLAVEGLAGKSFRLGLLDTQSRSKSTKS